MAVTYDAPHGVAYEPRSVRRRLNETEKRLYRFNFANYIAERNNAIVAANKDGYGCRRIARLVGMSAAQVSRIINQPDREDQ